MKKLVLSLVFGLVTLLNVFAQKSSDNDKVFNSLKDKRIDSIINSVTPVYGNHSNLKKQILNVLYDKKYDIILSAINTKGFKGLYYLNEYDGQDLKPNTTPDSVFVNTLKNFTNKLPKNKSKVISKFTNTSFINDKMLFEEYTYVNDDTTYFLRVVYINSQLNGMYLNIHSQY